VHLVGFITKKFVTMHGHMYVEYAVTFRCVRSCSSRSTQCRSPAVTSVCSFICCCHLGIIDCITVFARTNTRPPNEWVPAFLPPGVNRTGPEVDHLPLSISDVKNEWSYTSSPSCIASLCWQWPIYIAASARTSKKLTGWCDVLAVFCCGFQ
jgi:hypothetical protein